MEGWAGRILRVDLDRRKIVKEPLRRDFAHKFIGGRGFTSKILYDEVAPRTDPLGPENRLIIAVGPCNGTIVPGSTRVTIAAKSPLSGFLGDSNSGGTIGVELKYAGYDAVIIKGKAEYPSYLWIDDDNVELKDARHIWGKTTDETRRIIEAEIGDPKISVISIGPAGENLVRFAMIVADLGRANARCGIGAVMGSKNLKAIVVRGTKGVKVADERALENDIQYWRQLWDMPQFKRTREQWRLYGTVRVVSPFIKAGSTSMMNWTGVFKDSEAYSEAFSAEIIKDRYHVIAKSCFSCPLSCDHYTVISEGSYAGTFTEGLEATTFELLGTNLGNMNSDSIIKMKEVCDRLGLDIADMGGVLSWAIECFERGILSTEDTGNLKLEWGDYETFIKLIEMTAYKKGIGKLFAEGSKRASEIIGKGSEKYAMHVKGLTIDAREPRAVKGWALGHAVSSRGADHCRTLFASEYFDPAYNIKTEGKAEGIVWYENVRAFQNAMIVCEFCFFGDALIDPNILANFFNHVTGSSLTADQLLIIGERIINMERAFNLREGLTRNDDTLPHRFLREPLPDGPCKGQVVELDFMLDQYYKLRGWNKEGIPTKNKLMKLNLEEIADDILTKQQNSHNKNSSLRNNKK